MNHERLFRHLGLASSGIVALALVACDSGSGGGTGGDGTGATSTSGTQTTSAPATTTTSGGPATTSSGGTTTAGPSGSSSSGTTSGALMCPTNYCSNIGMGGYAFGYSDSQNMPPQSPGTSTATLAADGSLCISGKVMALPPNPTPADYSNDWGCGIGVDLNQAAATMMGQMTPKMPFTLTGTGVTVNVSNLPTCTQARVVLDQDGASPAYCAALTPGVEIPWSAFNTECWNDMGTALTGPPSSQAIKVQFVTSMTECDFSDFCITQISL